ncbi:sensor histidine kinase [uncultured Jatrophihabitans sp.]|uniref:sensor histidine kinase n=1 Tax=uncultured Jatrophihabitans sp. TaxID=1610747 RepID=UPI0035CA0D1B
MNLTATNILLALLWTAVAGVGVWFLLTPVRRRSLTGLLVTTVLTGAAASEGAMWGGMHAMLVPDSNWRSMAVLTALSVGVTGAVAYLAARHFSKDADALRTAVAELGEGRIPAATGRKLSAENEQVRRELFATATALAETRARESALESSRRELVSWVSHDLRTPLAGLRAMAEALEDGVVDDPDAYYKQIGASVERLNQMVEDLFDLSRIQAGVVSHERQRLSLDALVSDCVAALEPVAAAKNIHLSGSVLGVTTVNGSKPELNRALTNLVANAIRHTRARGHVDVQVKVTSMGRGPVAELIVRDECGGIPEAQLERVFEVGYRGQKARTTGEINRTQLNAAGAGLGLAITRGIVEAHAGTVDVANTEGGCRFRVLLPLTAAA